MWAKIFEYFLNLKIKRKLILFSSFYVGLVLLLLSATTLSWNAVENGHRQQESAYQIVRSVQSARIAEKSYLKYYQPMYERELVSNCIDILSLSRTLEGRIDRSKTSHIDRDIQLYRKIFGDVVRGYQKLFKTQKDIHECMDRVSSKIKRLDEISTEFSTREWIKDRYHNMAEWSSLYDRFLTEWNDEYLGIFAAYVESVLTPDLSKTLATLAEQKSELWFILQPIREGFDLFGTIPDTAQTAFSFTQTNANKMDEIGIQISLNADILLAESKSIILSIKTRMMWFMGYVGGAGCLLAVLAGVLLNQLISKSLNNVVEATRTLADGDLTTRVPVESQDEIGQMALQFNTFVERLQQIIRQIDENANLLSSSSTDLTDTSNRLTGSIEKMNLRASTVVKAGGELSTNIEFMAKSSEGISASVRHVATHVNAISDSIREVSAKCAKESDMAKLANQKVNEAHSLIKNLHEAAGKIGSIVQLIEQIADQTNLLALNAHIEASRSGGSGKGFTVVANEIKALAQQSTKATEEIAQQVLNIQGDIENSVKEIDDVTQIIEEVSSISNGITKVVKDQSMATSSIARTVEDTSQSTSELAQKVQRLAQVAADVSQNIREISHEIQRTTLGAAETFGSTEALSKMAIQLRKSIRQFKA